MSNLITIKQPVVVGINYGNQSKLLQNVNMKYYGQPQVPLEVDCSYEHQEAARRCFGNYVVELNMTFDDDGNLVDVTVAKF